MNAVHPTTLAVVKGALESIVNEMDTTFIRTAFSPLICEGRDQSNGLYEGDTGDLIVQGMHSLPIFIGSMQFAVRAVIEWAQRRGISPNDMILMNDPYLGGTHLPDVKMMRPFFYNGELFAWLANTGHWADVGGAVPGGFMGTAEDIFQEGLRIPPVRFVHDGTISEDLEAMILANVRVPEEGRGDIRAHINALVIGERRLRALIDKYGVETVRSCIQELKARSEAQMRSHIAEIPDGVYSFTDFLDNDGVEDTPIELTLDLEVRGDELQLDFSRSSAPVKGPMNSVLSTSMTACFIAVKHLYPDVHINAGCFRPLKFTIPPSTFLNAGFPRPVCGCVTETSQRVLDVIFGALAQALPDRVTAAAYSSMGNVNLGGHDPERGSYVMFVMTGGGYGGSRSSDGLTHGATTIGAARTTPVEVLEHRYPVRYTRFAIREDSAGPGRRRGGMGVIYELELLRGQAHLSYVGDRGHFPPFGILGGGPSAGMEIQVRTGTTWATPATTCRLKASRIVLKAGDGVRVMTPGGGGYDDPMARELELVDEDVRNGVVSAAQAEAVYGWAPHRARTGA